MEQAPQFPSEVRRGGCAIKKCRAASEASADGVVCSTNRAQRAPIRMLRDVEQTTPALRATPPSLGGDYYE